MKGVKTDSSGTNWAGYADYYTGQRGKFNQVYGYYNQPTYDVNSPSDAYECSWVGLGGIGSKSLIQAGTMMTPQNNPHYYAWYCYLDATSTVAPNIMSLVKVHPGDSMYDYVGWGIGGYQGIFEVWDWTNMTYYFVTVTVPAAYYDGESAEFIDERPLNTQDNLFYPVAGFDTPISWSSCEVFYPNNNQPVNFGTLPQYYQFTMYGQNAPCKENGREEGNPGHRTPIAGYFLFGAI